MFAHLHFDTQQTSEIMPDMAADIAAVIGGETDKNNLVSIPLDVPNTYIHSKVPSGWTMYDSDTGVASRYVFRAPCDGDPSQYKYLVWNLYVASGYIQMTYYICTDWNTSTNAPTDATTTETNVTFFRLSQVSEQHIELYVNEQIIVMRPFGPYSKTLIPIMEFTRNHPCFAVGQGYVPIVSCHQNLFSADATQLSSYVPRCVNLAGTADITNINVGVSAAGMFPSFKNFGEAYASLYRAREVDINGVDRWVLYPLYVEKKTQIGCVLGTSVVAKYYWVAGRHTTYPIIYPNAEHAVHQLEGIGNILILPEEDSDDLSTPRSAVFAES